MAPPRVFNAASDRPNNGDETAALLLDVRSPDATVSGTNATCALLTLGLGLTPKACAARVTLETKRRLRSFIVFLFFFLNVGDETNLWDSRAVWMNKVQGFYDTVVSIYLVVAAAAAGR